MRINPDTRQLAPFTTPERAALTEAAAAQRAAYRFQGTVGFTCGAFDLLHAGQVLMLLEAKAQCDLLVVGLHSDPSLDRPTKNAPVQCLEERYLQLRACRPVDLVVIYDTEEDLVALLQDLDPDVRIVGADWRSKPFTGHNLAIKVYYNSRAHDYSTSELRRRVVTAEGT